MPSYFRYLDENGALNSIEHRNFRVSRLDALNDPFDCAPHFEGNNANERMKCEMVATAHFRNRNTDLGLICLSRTWRAPLLWGHYADKHRGIALQLNFPKNTENLLPVRYCRRRPTVKYCDIGDDSKKDIISTAFCDSFTTKSPPWRYERESRYIIPLKECWRDSAGYYYQPLPNDRLVGVILGLRCKLTAADIAIRLRDAGYKGKTIWRIKMGTRHFSFIREKLTI